MNSQLELIRRGVDLEDVLEEADPPPLPAGAASGAPNMSTSQRDRPSDARPPWPPQEIVVRADDDALTPSTPDPWRSAPECDGHRKRSVLLERDRPSATSASKGPSGDHAGDKETCALSQEVVDHEFSVAAAPRHEAFLLLRTTVPRDRSVRARTGLWTTVPRNHPVLQ